MAFFFKCERLVSFNQTSPFKYVFAVDQVSIYRLQRSYNQWDRLHPRTSAECLSLPGSEGPDHVEAYHVDLTSPYYISHQWQGSRYAAWLCVTGRGENYMLSHLVRSSIPHEWALHHVFSFLPARVAWAFHLHLSFGATFGFLAVHGSIIALDNRKLRFPNRFDRVDHFFKF
jgi:hypothetical protein